MKISKFLLLLFICASLNGKSIQTEKIYFSISNRINDNHFSYVNLKIQNKTKKKYYLPAIYSNDSEKWHLLISPKVSDFFFFSPIFSDNQINSYSWTTTELYESVLYNNVYLESWEKKKNLININDLILLKAGESVEIKIPMNLSLQISDYCVWRLDNYDYLSKLNACVIYSKKDKSVERELLHGEIILKLNCMGYSLYVDEIISNKIIVTPNNDDIIQSKPYYIK